MQEPTIKQTDPATVAYLDVKGPYAQMQDVYGRLYGWIASHGLHPEGMPVAVFFTDPKVVPESEAIWEVRAPIASPPAEPIPDEDGVGVREVAQMKVVSVMHKGRYSELGAVYDELEAWVANHGLDVVGPPAEIYYSDPSDTAPEDYLTEIQFPVG